MVLVKNGDITKKLVHMEIIFQISIYNWIKNSVF